jgi:transcriptional regulator with XRE-family HTH domain
MTLDALADAAKISPSHLSRLERSQTLPSFPVLAKISDALGVDVNEFVRLERDVVKLDEEFARYLTVLAFGPEERAELLNLSIEARRSLVQRLRSLAGGSLTSSAVQTSAVEAAEGRDGVDGLRAMAKAIQKSGMSGVAFSRGLMRLAQMPGERRALFARPGLLGLPLGIDLVPIWRGFFHDEPLDPQVANWWQDQLRSQHDNGHQATALHAVVTRTALRGESGAKLAHYLLGALQENPASEVGLVDQELGPVNALVVDRSAAMLEQQPSRKASDEPVQAGLWIDGSDNSGVIERLIDDVWTSIPAEAKDRHLVIERLNAVRKDI